MFARSRMLPVRHHLIVRYVFPPLIASGRLSLKTNLSFGHLQGAAILAGHCLPLEVNYSWPATEPVLAAHRTYASGAVILAVCALEAWANEYHHDIIGRNGDVIGKAIAVADKVERMWDTVERLSLLRKYQWFLQLSGSAPLNEGQMPFQAAADLIELRDALVHYKPEWSHEAKQNQRLETRLGKKFPLNPLSKPDQLFIPHRCLGHGCGSWAVRSAIAFMTAFCESSGRQNLTTAYQSRIDAALAGNAV